MIFRLHYCKFLNEKLNKIHNNLIKLTKNLYFEYKKYWIKKESQWFDWDFKEINEWFKYLIIILKKTLITIIISNKNKTTMIIN